MEEVSHLIIKVSSDDVATAKTRLDSLGRASDTVMASIKGLVTAAIALKVFKELSSDIAEFTSNMAAVRAVTQATTDEFKQLSDAARALGQQGRFGANETSSAMKFLGQAGFTTGQIIGAMPGLLDLAAAGELNLSRATDVASAALIGFHLNAEEATRVADVFAVTAAAATTNVDQIGEAMKFVAPIANVMGKSLEETASIIGILSKNGLQASIAGTGLRQILSGLANPTRQAVDVLREYGVTLEDVDLKSHSITEVLETLAKAGLDANAAFQIFGDRGGPAFAALMTNIPALREMNGLLANSKGRAKEMADVMNDTLRGDWLKFTNSVTELNLALGEAGLTDILRHATQAGTGFVTTLGNMVKSGEAAGWIDLLSFKVGLLSDGFENAALNIEYTWDGMVEYVNGTGKEMSNNIINAFKYWPENVRAVTQAIGTILGAEWDIWSDIFRQNFQFVYDGWDWLVKVTRASLDLISDLLHGQVNGAWDAYVGKIKDAGREWNKAMDESYAESSRTMNAIGEAFEASIIAIADERDANIKASDDKLAKLRELRDEYNKQLAAIKAAQEAAANGKGTAGAPGTPPKDLSGGENHFDVEGFKALRSQLMSEEAAVQESYERRLELIHRNTKEGSDVRLELERQLWQQVDIEMDKAQQSQAQRFQDSYEAEQHQWQDALNRKIISQQEFTQLSAENWEKYMKRVASINIQGASLVATIQLGMYSQVLESASTISEQLNELANRDTAAGNALFAVSKAIAIAQAVVNTELAATKALAEGGFILGIPMASAIRALGYASVGIMAGTAIAQVGHIGKFEHGGMIGAGDIGIVGEAGPEIVRGPAMVTSARSTADRRNQGGDKSINLTIINQAGVEVTTTKRETADSTLVDIMLRRTEDYLAGKVDTGGGKLARSLERRYNLRRGQAA